MPQLKIPPPTSLSRLRVPPPSTDNRSFFGKAFDTVFTPPKRVSDFYDRTRAKTSNPWLRGGLHVAEAFSTPGDMALTAGTGGLGLLAKSGIKALSKAPGLIKSAYKGVSGATAARGAERIITDEGGLDKGVGAAQLGLGLLGARGLGKSLPSPKQQPLKIPKPQTPIIKTEGLPERKLIDALKHSKPIQQYQSALRSKEKGKRISRAVAAGKKTYGRNSFYAKLGQLKGEYPKIQLQSLVKNVKETDIHDLFNTVDVSKNIDAFEKITAQRGLDKLLGMEGAVIPQAGELKLLGKVFGEEFVGAVEGAKPLLMRAKELGWELLNTPKTIKSTFDLSAPFRQGAFMVRRKEFWKNLPKMFKEFASEKALTSSHNEIISRPTYGLMKRGQLALTDLANMTNREEAIMATLPERLKLLPKKLASVDPLRYFGRGVRASNRAYTGFLNRLRADSFDDLITHSMRAGRDPKADATLIAEYVNNATGRGSLGMAEGAAKTLNSIFYSPRLISSRVALLNPKTYIDLPSFMRKEALKDLVGFAAFQASIGGLAAVAGAKVDIGIWPFSDDTSPDLAKVRVNDTRIDSSAGFQQYIRATSRIGQFLYETTVKGKKPETFKTGEDILINFARNKLSPTAATLGNLLRGADFVGEPLTLNSEAIRLVAPMILEDAYELAKEDPDLMPFIFPAIFGASVQTYKERKKNKFSLF